MNPNVKAVSLLFNLLALLVAFRPAYSFAGKGNTLLFICKPLSQDEYEHRQDHAVDQSRQAPQFEGWAELWQIGSSDFAWREFENCPGSSSIFTQRNFTALHGFDDAMQALSAGREAAFINRTEPGNPNTRIMRLSAPDPLPPGAPVSNVFLLMVYKASSTFNVPRAGDLRMDSRVGQGEEFTCRSPLPAPDISTPSKRSRSRSPGTNGSSRIRARKKATT